eukprot:3668764-Rhodomonas_salina.1
MSTTDGPTPMRPISSVFLLSSKESREQWHCDVSFSPCSKIVSINTQLDKTMFQNLRLGWIIRINIKQSVLISNQTLYFTDLDPMTPDTSGNIDIPYTNNTSFPHKVLGLYKTNNTYSRVNIIINKPVLHWSDDPESEQYKWAQQKEAQQKEAQQKEAQQEEESSEEEESQQEEEETRRRRRNKKNKHSKSNRHSKKSRS